MKTSFLLKFFLFLFIISFIGLWGLMMLQDIFGVVPTYAGAVLIVLLAGVYVIIMQLLAAARKRKVNRRAKMVKDTQPYQWNPTHKATQSMARNFLNKQ